MFFLSPSLVWPKRSFVRSCVPWIRATPARSEWSWFRTISGSSPNFCLSCKQQCYVLACWPKHSWCLVVATTTTTSTPFLFCPLSLNVLVEYPSMYTPSFGFLFDLDSSFLSFLHNTARSFVRHDSEYTQNKGEFQILALFVPVSSNEWNESTTTIVCSIVAFYV